MWRGREVLLDGGGPLAASGAASAGRRRFFDLWLGLDFELEQRQQIQRDAERDGVFANSPDRHCGRSRGIVGPSRIESSGSVQADDCARSAHPHAASRRVVLRPEGTPRARRRRPRPGGRRPGPQAAPKALAARAARLPVIVHGVQPVRRLHELVRRVDLGACFLPNPASYSAKAVRNRISSPGPIWVWALMRSLASPSFRKRL